MKIQDAKIIMQSNLIMMRMSNEPELTLQVETFQTIMNYIDELEETAREYQLLQSKNIIKEMPGGRE